MRELRVLIGLLMSLQGISQNSQVIDSVIVTALRAPITVAQTGRSVSIIDAQDIKGYNANSIDEILQLATGVEVQSRGGFGVQSDILMRGSTFTQVLVLVDGMRINDPLTGHFNGYIPVAQEEIARIEVLRGSASAVFGPDAVGGVINIITKVNDTREHPRSISGSIGLGQHKLRDFNLGISESTGQLKYSAGVSVRQSDGELIEPASSNPDVSVESYRTFFDIKTAGVGLSYAFNPQWKLSARSSVDLRDFDARYFYTTSTFDKSVETVNNVFNHVMLQHIGDNSSTQLDVAHKYNTDEFVFSPDFPSTNNHTTQFTNVMLTDYRSINDNSAIKTGVQLDRRSIVSNDRGDHSDHHIGIYASYLYESGSLYIIPNVRYDYDSNYGGELLPSINISYNLPQLTVRGSAGRSVRAADYTERFVSNNLENLTPGRSLGNPDLLAERSWSAEIGLDYRLAANWTLSGTVYSRWSNDLIDYISTNESSIGTISEIGSLQSGADYFYASNIADVQTSGIELESNLSLPIGESGSLSLSNSLSLIDQSSGEDIISVYLANSAKLLSTNRLSFNAKSVSIHLTGLYKDRNGRVAEAIGSELSEDYFLMNATVAYQLNDHVELSAQMLNLSNTKYQNILGAAMPGRWFKGSLNWRF